MNRKTRIEAECEKTRPKDLHFYCDDCKCGAKKFWAEGYVVGATTELKAIIEMIGPFDEEGMKREFQRLHGGRNKVSKCALNLARKQHEIIINKLLKA